MIQHSKKWWTFCITVHGGNTPVLYTHGCINPPSCMLICSICSKLHCPCSQHGCLCTTITTELLDVSAALSGDHLWILWASFQKREISTFLYFFCLSCFYFHSFLYLQPSILFFLTASSLSSSPRSLTLSLFLQSTDACGGKVPLSLPSNHHQPLPHA